MHCQKLGTPPRCYCRYHWWLPVPTQTLPWPRVFIRVHISPSKYLSQHRTGHIMRCSTDGSIAEYLGWSVWTLYFYYVKAEWFCWTSPSRKRYILVGRGHPWLLTAPISSGDLQRWIFSNPGKKRRRVGGCGDTVTALRHEDQAGDATCLTKKEPTERCKERRREAQSEMDLCRTPLKK